MKWPVVKVGDEVTIKGGGTPSRKVLRFYEGDIPWATIKDLSSLYLNHTQEHITTEAVKSSAANLIPAGNVILATRVGLGKVAINTVDVAINQDLKALFCSPRLAPKYLCYYLSSLSSSIANQGVGATVKGITLNQVESWPLPLPPLAEQRRIVEILDQADALRHKRAEADAKAARILPTLFYQMFGDPATNPMGWPTTTLSRAGASIRYGLGQPPEPSQEGIPIIRATNVKRGSIVAEDMMLIDPRGVPESRNAFLSKDEVIVVRSGAYTGDVAQVTKQWEGSAAGYDLVVTPGENFCGEYLESFLLTSHIQKNYFGNIRARAGQPHLNAAQLQGTPVLVPPMGRQSMFAKCVNNLRNLNSHACNSGTEISIFFQTLLHRAFTGDLTAHWREEHLEEKENQM